MWPPAVGSEWEVPKSVFGQIMISQHLRFLVAFNQCSVGGSKVSAVVILESCCFLFFRNGRESIWKGLSPWIKNNLLIRYLWVHRHLACFGLICFWSQTPVIISVHELGSFYQNGSSHLSCLTCQWMELDQFRAEEVCKMWGVQMSVPWHQHTCEI